MNRRFALMALSFPVVCSWSQVSKVDEEVQVQVPLRIETLASDLPTPQVGAAIVISDLADADKQVSTVLLRGLQDLGLAIETPALDLDKFLLPGQEWRSTVRELNVNWIAEHNAYDNASMLPPGRVYAVQYTGRYRYASSMLNIAMAVSLFERSALGPLRPASTQYSRRFFADKLERSIKSRLTVAETKP
jgi:hypothetical protein